MTMRTKEDTSIYHSKQTEATNKKYDASIDDFGYSISYESMIRAVSRFQILPIVKWF